MVRLYERAQTRGYDPLLAYAEARSTVPLVELADELGELELAPSSHHLAAARENDAVLLDRADAQEVAGVEADVEDSLGGIPE